MLINLNSYTITIYITGILVLGITEQKAVINTTKARLSLLAFIVQK